MTDERLARRLEKDLLARQDALRRSDLDGADGEYQEILALGLRMKAIDFSSESSTYADTLQRLRAEYGQKGRPRLFRLPAGLSTAGAYMALLLLLLAAVVFISRLPESTRSVAPVSPDSSGGSSNAFASLIPQEYLDAINVALSYESDQRVFSYDPESRDGTRIVGVFRTTYEHAGLTSDPKGESADPSGQLWIVPISGEWIPRGVEPGPRVTRLRSIEVFVDASTGLPVRHSIAGDQGDRWDAGQLPEGSQLIPVSDEALAAINAALEFESWLPPASSLGSIRREVRPTSISRVVRTTAADLSSAGLDLPGVEAEKALWAVRVEGDWQTPLRHLTAEQRLSYRSATTNFSELYVVVDPMTGERLDWKAGSFGRELVLESELTGAALYVLGDGEGAFSLPSIAEQYGVRTETLMWSLWELQAFSVPWLEPGGEVLIPPEDGAYHLWLPLDSLNLVAHEYGVTPEMIAGTSINEPHLRTEGFSPSYGDLIFVPLDSEQCSPKLYIPVFYRCTHHPEGGPDEYSVRTYVVKEGDSLLSIAEAFGLKADTILWSNEMLMEQGPQSIQPGLELFIPPQDGIYYQWGSQDSLELIAGRFEVDPESIMDWPGNASYVVDGDFLADPGEYVFVPGGTRPLTIEGDVTPSENGQEGAPSESCSAILFSYSTLSRFGVESHVVSTCPDGSNRRRLTSEPTGNYFPEWSPDGTQIAFLSARTGTRELYVMNADGGNVRQITFGFDLSDLIWLPDGHRVAVLSDADPQRRTWLAADVVTGDVLPLTYWSYDPSFRPGAYSHDGTRLAYVQWADGPERTSQIRIRDIDGSNDYPLTDDTAMNRSPIWSQDDSRIAFLSDQGAQDGQAAIYTVNVDGTDLQLIAASTDSMWTDFAWSPDGALMAIYDHPRVYVLNLETGQETTLFTVEEPHYIASLSWQP